MSIDDLAVENMEKGKPNWWGIAGLALLFAAIFALYGYERKGATKADADLQSCYRELERSMTINRDALNYLNTIEVGQ